MPLLIHTIRDIEQFRERLWCRIERDNIKYPLAEDEWYSAPQNCWIWKGGKAGPSKTPAITIGHKYVSVRRLMWEMYVNQTQPMRAPLTYDCQNPMCVRHIRRGRHRDKQIVEAPDGSIRQAPKLNTTAKATTRARLTIPQIQEIRRLLHSGYKPSEIRDALKVSEATISRIRRAGVYRGVKMNVTEEPIRPGPATMAPRR